MSNIIVGGYPSGGFYTQDDIIGYKVYTAVLTQEGSDPPAVTVIKNTLGFEPQFTYEGVGEYFCIHSDVWVRNKTFVSINQTDGNTLGIVGASPVNGPFFVIRSYDLTGTLADEVISNASIEIRIYP